MTVDLSFPHSWQAQILQERPLILPRRHFIYPRQAEEIERGALEVTVRPREGEPFLGTFALGFADPAVPSGLWSCPAEDELCAVAGGYAYIVNTLRPEQWTHLAFRPVLEIQAVPSHALLLFAGHYALVAWGPGGRAWESPRLSSEGLRITEIAGDQLQGFGWDLLTDREVPFTLDLRTGQRLNL